jgi:hypothetical protein
MTIRTRALNADGLDAYAKWLDKPLGSLPPLFLTSDESYSEPFGDYVVDADQQFGSRLEFGRYLDEQLSGADFNGLMSPDSDGLWAWLTAVYFGQLSAKGIRRAEHYLVMRKGSAGSLAYRNAARTSYELFHIHGERAWICLRGAMHTFGDMTEQLASRQTIAHNKGFFHAAYDMYVHEGAMRRGSSSKPRKPRDRKAGDRTGFGSVRRLAIALQRLDLTYDTEEMSPDVMRSVLPREFGKWLATKPEADLNAP